MTVGFIGTGNMGGALARAVARAEGIDKLLLADAFKGKAEALAAEIGAEASDNELIAETADYIFLAVKPQMMGGMLGGIAPILKKRYQGGSRFVLVTIAAGLTMETIGGMAGGSYPTVRIMPNTPASIGEGVILYTRNDIAEESDCGAVAGFLKHAGLLSRLPESLIDAGTALSGSGPAYVYLFIEALADGGVLAGLPRADALRFAAQTVAGSARLVLESGSHPGVLKDAVCSPAGTTIEGVRVLEESGFRGAVIDAVRAAYEKSRGIK